MDERPATETPGAAAPGETGTPGGGESKRPRPTGRDDGAERRARVSAVGEPRGGPGRPAGRGADPDLVADLHRIGERCACLLGSGPSSEEIGDFLFDERGLPK